MIAGTHARYTGRLAELLHDLSPTLAAGFALHDLEEVHTAMSELRHRLEGAS